MTASVLPQASGGGGRGLAYVASISAQDALTIGCFLFEVLHEAVLKELLRLRWRQELADRDERAVICFQLEISRTEGRRLGQLKNGENGPHY